MADLVGPSFQDDSDGADRAGCDAGGAAGASAAGALHAAASEQHTSTRVTARRRRGGDAGISDPREPVDLIRFGGRVDCVDLVSSSFVAGSQQVLGGIRISIRCSLVAADEHPVAI
jgi:hypothetical protein